MNPYHVLGVPPTATPAQIRKAFRRKVRKVHPDTGGDDKAFRELHLSYKILSDDTRREKYDRTGSVDEEQPDNAEVLPRQIVMGALFAVLDSITMANADIERVDIITSVGQSIEQRIADIDTQRAQLAKIRVTYAKVKDRFETDEENFIGLGITSHLIAIDRKDAGMVMGRTATVKALELLKTYRYRAEVRRMVLQWSSVTASVTRGA